MRGGAKVSCGVYCLRDPRNRARTHPWPPGCSAPGNPPTCAGLLPSRFLPPIIPFSGAWQRISDGPRHGQPNYRLGSAVAPRRAKASSGAPVVNALFTSKKRRLSTWLPGRVAKAPRTDPSAPPNSAIAYQGAPAYVPAALLYAAISAFSPAVSRTELPACIPFRVRRAAVLEPLRPPPSHRPQRTPLPQADLRTTIPAARSARITATESPARPRFHTTQSCVPSQRHKSCPGKRGKAAAAPAPASIQAVPPPDLAYDAEHTCKR